MVRNELKITIRPPLLLLFVLSCLGCGQQPEASGKAPPDILLILVDALRADHISGYGYARKTTPFLDEYTEKGVRFSSAYSHSSHTKISVASLFTGLLPPSHGVRTAAIKEQAGRVKSDTLSTSVDTLAEILQRHGYSTAGFVTNPHVQAFQGFAQGFDEYQYGDFDARSLNQRAISWLENHSRSPYFLYLHYMDVHYPYDPPRPYRTRYVEERKGLKPLFIYGPASRKVSQEKIDDTVALYDAQINYWDDSFREFIERLDERSLLENAVVVIVSDHGDEFNDHGGFGHGFTLYTEMIHVPMYFIFEGKLASGIVRDDLVQLIDVVPTLYGLSGIETVGMNLEGVDLFDSRHEEADTDRRVYSETYLGEKPRSVRTVGQQLVFNATRETWELYDLSRDPAQKNDLYRGNTPEVSELVEQLSELMKDHDLELQPGSVELDERTIQELRKLGYLE